MRITDKYVFFLKEYLSQWHQSPFFDQEGILYNCAEQYMMAQKALMFNDNEAYNGIMGTDSPNEQKRLGRLVGTHIGSDPFDVEKWSKYAGIIVWRGNLFKFTQNAGLREKLLSTGELELVEVNPRDSIWGIGLSEDDDDCLDKTKWKGQNLLGKALMDVRKKISKVEFK